MAERDVYADCGAGIGFRLRFGDGMHERAGPSVPGHLYGNECARAAVGGRVHRDVQLHGAGRGELEAVGRGAGLSVHQSAGRVDAHDRRVYAEPELHLG
jgi:hypothetical protein